MKLIIDNLKRLKVKPLHWGFSYFNEFIGSCFIS